MNSDDTQALADDLLTFIEQREAAQIAYGVYDVTMTGAEVLAGYRPVDVTRVPLVDREGALKAALGWLAAEVLIIRFDGADEPAEWVFRSRIAEMVRLLSRLRQRLPPRSDSEQRRQHISRAKALSGDVTFHVVPRQVPRRHRTAADYLALLGENPEHADCARLLHTAIMTHLPKLQKLSQFQEDALREILQVIELSAARDSERGVVVTADTGAGKTYAFFLPVLAKVILDRSLRNKIGVKAICIYPRLALSENQLRDFVEAIFCVNQALAAEDLPLISIGIESGSAVYECSDFQSVAPANQERLARRGWRYDAQFGGYLAPFAYCVGSADYACAQVPQQLGVLPTASRTLCCPACGTTYPFIQFARDVMAEAPPDILIATTESLNKRLITAQYQYLFGTDQFCAPSVVMHDEIHLQTSTAGTQVALLLRRLLARMRLGKQERGERANLAFVGLSATIADPRAFLAELSGIPAQNIREVRPKDAELAVIGAERYIFVRAGEGEDTAVISTLIQTAMCVLHTMPQPPSDSPLARYRAFGFVQSLDDEALMCVIQYTAPSNVASFVQRKGRGGRKVGTRPLVVTVLSPYKSTDLFLFRNQHLLTDPTFRKLPLNAQNRYLQRIHGFYALCDWLAYRAHSAGFPLDIDYLSRSALAYLMEQTVDVKVLLAFKDYLRQAFAMDSNALSRVLTEEAQGLLMSILSDGLVRQAHPFLVENRGPIKTRELLRNHLPQNLFSDINLPEVQVDYRPDDPRMQKWLNTESISLALNETIPGNVTFRGGQGAVWVPPQPVAGTHLLALAPHYICEELHDRAKTVNLPGRVLRLLDIRPQQLRELVVLRPQKITPARFSEDHKRVYWYANAESGALREHRGPPEEIPDMKRLAHSSAAFALNGVTLRAERERPPRDYKLAGNDSAIWADPLSRKLIEQIVLYQECGGARTAAPRSLSSAFLGHLRGSTRTGGDLPSLRARHISLQPHYCSTSSCARDCRRRGVELCLGVD